MKSATSTLYQQLKSQPGIFMPDLKEPNFFSDDEVWERGFGWYSGLFASASGTDICGEASTHYTKLPTYPSTIERMVTVAPTAKLIYIIRDPVDRLVSQYVHQWSEREIRCDIDKAIIAHRELIDYSRYAYQIRGYLEAFGPDSVLITFFEHLKSNPQMVLERIADLIGYSGSPEWQSDQPADNVSNTRVRRFPFDEYLVRSPAATLLRQALVPKAVRRQVRRHLTMRSRPELSGESLKRLNEEFCEDLKELACLLNCGIDVDCADATTVYNRIEESALVSKPFEHIPAGSPW